MVLSQLAICLFFIDNMQLYHPDIVHALVSTLKAVLEHRRTAVAYLALTVRNPDLLRLFLTTVKVYGLDHEELNDEPRAQNEFIEISEGVDQKVILLRITAAPSG